MPESIRDNPPLDWEEAKAEPPVAEIVHEEYYAVIGLLKLAENYNNKLKDIEDALAKLLPHAHEDTICEAVYENMTALELLDREQIAVVGER